MIVACTVYRQGQRCATPSLDELGPWLEQPDVVVWVGLRSPTPEEFEAVRVAFSLPAQATGLALEPHSHPSFTTLGSVANLILRTANHSRQLDRLFLGEVSVFCSERFVVTVRFGVASPLDLVRARLESTPELFTLGVVGVVHAIIEHVVNDYIPVLHELEREVIDIERRVFTDEAGDTQRSTQRIYHLKREVLDLYGVIDTLGDPLDRLIRSREPWMVPEGRERLHDLDDQVVRLSNRARSLSELLTSALGAQLTQVSVRQNEDMRHISAWAAILTVPTMIAGIYGMNFESMPELTARYGYPVVLGVIAGICTGLYRWFRRHHWL